MIEFVDYNSALELQCSGQYSNAIKIYTKAIKNEGREVSLLTALCNRAACYYELDFYKMCLKDCDKVILQDKNGLFKTKALYYKALSFLKQGKVKDAENALYQATTYFCTVDMRLNVKKLLDSIKRGTVNDAIQIEQENTNRSNLRPSSGNSTASSTSTSSPTSTSRATKPTATTTMTKTTTAKSTPSSGKSKTINEKGSKSNSGNKNDNTAQNKSKNTKNSAMSIAEYMNRKVEAHVAKETEAAQRFSAAPYLDSKTLRSLIKKNAKFVEIDDDGNDDDDNDVSKYPQKTKVTTTKNLPATNKDKTTTPKEKSKVVQKENIKNKKNAKIVEIDDDYDDDDDDVSKYTQKTKDTRKDLSTTNKDKTTSPKEKSKVGLKENIKNNRIELSQNKNQKSPGIKKDEVLNKFIKEKKQMQQEEMSSSRILRNADLEIIEQQKRSTVQPPKIMASNANANANAKMSEQESLKAAEMVANLGLLQNGSGIASIDQKVARGYLMVNSNRLADGKVIFNDILKINAKVAAARVGLGTIFALDGDYVQSEKEFTAALKINPNQPDVLKRRGQVRCVLGKETESLIDFIEASKKSTDPELFQLIGGIHYQRKDFEEASKQYYKAINAFNTTGVSDKAQEGIKQAWLMLGVSENNQGNVDESLRCYKKLCKLDPQNYKVLINIGRLYKDYGNYDLAREYLNKALKLKEETLIHELLGSLHYGNGNISKALECYKSGLKLGSNDEECLYSTALCEHGLGSMRNAFAAYKELLQYHPQHYGAFNFLICKVLQQNLDTQTTDICLDSTLPPLLKEGWIRQEICHEKLDYSYLRKIPDVNSKDKKVPYSEEKARNILTFCEPFGLSMQYDTPGFAKNKRQLRMAGLAILDVAQHLRQVIDEAKKGKKKLFNHVNSNKNTNRTTFDWRDMFDIVVKWRQFSEPRDSVFWVDWLSEKQFKEGFGSQTAMLLGQAKVVRYYPYFERSMAILRTLVSDQVDFTTKKNVSNMDHKELRQAVGRDFYVCTPCHSTKDAKRVFEGTRLTIQKFGVSGHQVSIRTPGTPTRCEYYEEELAFHFDNLVAEAAKENPDSLKLWNLVLTISFYWYNFMPLARGTSAVGFIGMLGMFLALDMKVIPRVPKGFQFDWEAILTPKPEEFIESMKWMKGCCEKLDFSVLTLDSVTMTFPTIRTVIDVLNRDFQFDREGTNDSKI